MNRFRSFLSRSLLAACLALACLGPALALDLAGDPRFRADDSGIWGLRSNPALAGLLGDDLYTGLGCAAVGADGRLMPLYEGGEDAYQVNVLTGAGSLALDLRAEPGEAYYGFAWALPLPPAFSMGLSLGALRSAPSDYLMGLGLLARPCAELSLGMTVDDALSASPGLGFGAALRPLAFLGEAGSAFALTADAHLADGSLALESAGASLELGPAALRGWWDFDRAVAGAAVSIALGGETGLVLPEATDPAALRARYSMGFDLPGGPSSIPGKRVVLVKDLKALSATSLPPSPFPSLTGGAGMTDLASLLRLVKAAAEDGSVVALAFEDLPPLAGFAAPQELAAALAAFRKAGKKLYFYADDYVSASNYELLAGAADRIVLEPNGGLYLTGLGSKRLYMKSALAKLGIEFVNLAPWETKSANNNLTYDSMPKLEREQLTRLLGDLQGQIDGAFAASRSSGLRKEAAALVAEGPYLTASSAREAGLADEVMYRAEFEDWLSSAHPLSRLDEAYAPEPSRAWGRSLFRKKAVVLHLNGSIVDGEGQAGVSTGSLAAKAIAELREDPFVKAIVLRVDSPGGSAATSDLIAREARLAKEAGKLVVVSMGNYAASGGYYVSAGASRIFAEPGTLTGSIGVTGAIPNFSKALAKLGLGADGVAISDSSDFLDTTASFSEADLERMSAKILAVYDRFVEVVAAGRGLGADRVRELGRGQVWTGREALANGLVDELGGIDAAKDYVRSELGRLVDFEDRFPGAMPGLGASLAGAAADLLGPAPASAEAAALGTLVKALGPAALRAASRAAEILAMGKGPLLYAEGIEDIE